MTTESAQPIKYLTTQPRSPGSPVPSNNSRGAPLAFLGPVPYWDSPTPIAIDRVTLGSPVMIEWPWHSALFCLIGRRIIRDTPYPQDPSWQSKPQRTPAVSRTAHRPPGTPSRLHRGRTPGRNAASAACTDRPGGGWAATCRKRVPNDESSCLPIFSASLRPVSPGESIGAAESIALPR